MPGVLASGLFLAVFGVSVFPRSGMSEHRGGAGASKECPDRESGREFRRLALSGPGRGGSPDAERLGNSQAGGAWGIPRSAKTAYTRAGEAGGGGGCAAGVVLVAERASKVTGGASESSGGANGPRRPGTWLPCERREVSRRMAGTDRSEPVSRGGPQARHRVKADGGRFNARRHAESRRCSDDRYRLVYSRWMGVVVIISIHPPAVRWDSGRRDLGKRSTRVLLSLRRYPHVLPSGNRTVGGFSSPSSQPNTEYRVLAITRFRGGLPTISEVVVFLEMLC